MNGEQISVLGKKKDNNENMSSKYLQDEISVSEHIVHEQRYTNESTYRYADRLSSTYFQSLTWLLWWMVSCKYQGQAILARVTGSGAGFKGQGKGIIDYYSTVNMKGSKSNCSNDNKITGCIIVPGIGCLCFMPTLLLNKVTSLFTGIKAEVYAERMNTYDFSYI